MNRTFATAKDRRSVGLEKTDWIGKESENENAGKNLIHIGRSTRPTSKYNHHNLQLSLDGWFPLGPCENFAVRNLGIHHQGSENEESRYFPPDTTIVVSNSQ